MSEEKKNYPEFFTSPDRSPEQIQPQEVSSVEHENSPEREVPSTHEIPAEAEPLVHSDEGEREVVVPGATEEFDEMTPDQVLKSPNAIVLEKILDHELNMDEAYQDQEEILNFSQQ